MKPKRRTWLDREGARLREAIRGMSRKSLIYELLRDELKNRGWWRQKRTTRLGGFKKTRSRGNVPRSEYLALKFADMDAFERATEIVAAKELHARPIGHLTLVIRRGDARPLEGLRYTSHKVLRAAILTSDQVKEIRPLDVLSEVRDAPHTNRKSAARQMPQRPSRRA